MYGPDLQRERRLRRKALRFEMHGKLPGGTFLDVEDLLMYIALAPTRNEGLQLNRRLLPHALLSIGVREEQIRAAFNLRDDEPVRVTLAELVAGEAMTKALDDQVLAELPETPEPGRGPAPVPDNIKGILVGPPDPRLVYPS